mmetsp:Transcript_34334/g.80343  ORF Transcript_34334/g.80343 Transcript_34334/m.80343 type:complete len:491 (-) Transcript_34334:144-1616(-)
MHGRGGKQSSHGQSGAGTTAQGSKPGSWGQRFGSFGEFFARSSQDTARKADESELYEIALDMLYGTRVNLVLCITALVLSLGLAVAGFIRMTDDAADTGCAIGMLVTAVVFLVAQAATASKVSRDYRSASNLRGGLAGEPQVLFQFLEPSRAYIIQVCVLLVLAIAAAAYSLAEVNVESEWYGFAILAMLWVLVSMLSTAKTFRDRREAEIWKQIPKESHGKWLQQVVAACGGSIEHTVLVWLAFLASTALTFAWIWFGFSKEELAAERKGLLSLAILYNIASDFHVSKLFFDGGHGVKQPLSMKFMVVGNFVVSLVVPVVAIVSMNLAADGTFFLITGVLMTAHSTLSLAKSMQDTQEVEELNERVKALSTSDSASAAEPTIIKTDDGQRHGHSHGLAGVMPHYGHQGGITATIDETREAPSGAHFQHHHHHHPQQPQPAPAPAPQQRHHRHGNQPRPAQTPRQPEDASGPADPSKQGTLAGFFSALGV